MFVNASWIAFLVAAETILPESVGDINGWPRAVVRVGIVLIPSLAWLAKSDQSSWAHRMGLVANCRRGVLVGVAVSLLWFLPQFIVRWQSGEAGCRFDLPGGVWLNAIVGSPLAEELLYRQIIFQRLRVRLELWKAVCVSSLWFTLLHLPAALFATAPLEVLHYLTVIFGYGIVFALLFAFTRSLWGSLIPHVVNNIFHAVVAGQ